jgi:hypothetical protein
MVLSWSAYLANVEVLYGWAFRIPSFSGSLSAGLADSSISTLSHTLKLINRVFDDFDKKHKSGNILDK